MRDELLYALVQHNHELLHKILGALGEIANGQKHAAKRERKMSAALDRLETEVSEIGTVVDSAIALLTNIAQQIRDAAGNEAKANKLADALDGKATELATAVAASTAAEDEPPADGGDTGGEPPVETPPAA